MPWYPALALPQGLPLRVQAEGCEEQLLGDSIAAPRCRNGTAREQFGVPYERDVGVHERALDYIFPFQLRTQPRCVDNGIGALEATHVPGMPSLPANRAFVLQFRAQHAGTPLALGRTRRTPGVWRGSAFRHLQAQLLAFLVARLLTGANRVPPRPRELPRTLQGAGASAWGPESRVGRAGSMSPLQIGGWEETTGTVSVIPRPW